MAIREQHISGLKEKVRKALDLLSSRVGVGLLMASLLQVGDLPIMEGNGLESIA